MQRERAVETARAVLTDGAFSRADAVALALHVLEIYQQRDFEDAFSPSASPIGGGENPAAPAIAPVSKKSDAVSPARNLEAPSGASILFPKEADTITDVNQVETNAATIPTVYPTAGMGWQDEQIARWLEGHASGYEHGGHHDIAKAHRKRALQVRRRDYLDEPSVPSKKGS